MNPLNAFNGQSNGQVQQDLYGDEGEEQQQLNSGYYNPADEAEHRNARTYYLDPDKLLRDLKKYLTGRMVSTGARNESLALVPDIAAEQIINQIRIPMDKVSLLSNLRPEEINERVYRIREGVAGWLVVEGYPRYKININNYELIINQVETLLLSAFKWAQNGGGRHFLTTSSRSIETQSHVLNNEQRMNNSGGNRRMFNPFKPMG